MSKDILDREEDKITRLGDMYEDYFLDYASYVILERAVPSIEDGLKPVQRRILYSLREKEDGRYHKVANIIGHTMQYHPHGDAAIGDAMVNLGQKDLMIDTQGNWGDVNTGDSAAAPRYIEARLTKFALEVAFNKQTTEWQLSYDGRNKEPINLPMKFPLLLAQGVEGIAVGLSTKILPHNFLELIDASIDVLRGKEITLYPDFYSGGMIDVSDYNGGKRGGRVKVRARIEIENKSTLLIKELPFGVTSSAMIDSVLKANDKGQIKIKKIVDNTAKEVEIQINLGSNVSPELTIDALYAFTNCEISISPNACVIIEDKPHFVTVEEILRICTAQTKELLRRELEIRKNELEEKWHLASLEKIFIENRIYRDIEEAESFEEALEIIDKGLRKYVATPNDQAQAGDNRIQLLKEISEDDLIKLTEIRIKRISKYNKFKHEENMQKLLDELQQVKYDLAHLTDYTVAYYQNLRDKYGEGKERRTKITSFETIAATAVVANNAKLYVNRSEGFFGMGLKKDEFVSDCADIDDIIVFKKDGSFQVSRIDDKVFVGKGIIHCAVWKKGDERTTYNMVYLDGGSGRIRAKRFNVKAITRDKSYDLTKGAKGSKVLYFSAQPNGESELLQVTLTPGCSARKKVFEFDFADISIKGRKAAGNVVTKYPVKKITQLELGKSTLGAIKVWMDDVSGRLNKDERGKYLGAFDTGEQIIALYHDGSYELHNVELDAKIELSGLLEVSKIVTEKAAIGVVHYVGEKDWTMVKRFKIETATTDERFSFISDSSGSKLCYATALPGAILRYTLDDPRKNNWEEEFALDDFVAVKGWKAMGNKLCDGKAKKVELVKRIAPPKPEKEKLKPGESLELDL